MVRNASAKSRRALHRIAVGRVAKRLTHRLVAKCKAADRQSRSGIGRGRVKQGKPRLERLFIGDVRDAQPE